MSENLLTFWDDVDSLKLCSDLQINAVTPILETKLKFAKKKVHDSILK